jgi:hypothetical protein
MGTAALVAAAIHGCACPARETISAPGHRVLPEGAGLVTVNFATLKIDCALRSTPNMASRNGSDEGTVPTTEAVWPTESTMNPTPAPPARPAMFCKPGLSSCI